MNGVHEQNSCEQSYISLRSNQYSYSPFTKKSYEQAVVNGGHTLNSFLYTAPQYDSESLKLWVTGFILRLITRDTDNNYRLESAKGKIDMKDPKLKKYITLGQSRSEAYKLFEGLEDSIKQALSKEEERLLKDPTIKTSYDELFDGTPEARVKYKTTYSLTTDEDFINEQELMEWEFNILT